MRKRAGGLQWRRNRRTLEELVQSERVDLVHARGIGPTRLAAAAAGDSAAWIVIGCGAEAVARDRAYARAIRILGPTPEILNNQGYSYLLRGDYRHAREKLVAARDLDPGNPYIQNNLDLLAKSARPR